MQNERYHHGYGHCLAKGCAIKDDCVHYLAYLEAKELNLKEINTFDHCKDTELGYVRVRIEKK